MTSITNNQIQPNATTTVITGLTSQDAMKRIKQNGPNAVAESKKHAVLLFLKKFWGPLTVVLFYLPLVDELKITVFKLAHMG